MGSEYFDISLKEILDAEKIFTENKDLFNEMDERTLINNLCWYHLEKYLVTYFV